MKKLLILIAVLGMVSALFAQNTDFEVGDTGEKSGNDSFNIEVTAQKRKENIQDVPASITAMNAADIKDADIDETQDIADYVPNMATFNFSDSFSYYSLRGQTNFNSYSSPIGIYVDDVPAMTNGNWTDIRLWNIEQIEVLRGPSGNLYGLNSTGGVINVKTRKPDNVFVGGASAGYGSYNSVNLAANVSGPILKDTLYFGVSGDYRRSESYIEEKGNDDRSHYFGGGRGQIRYTPFNELDIMLTVDGGHYEADYNTWTLADNDPYKIPGHNHDEFYKYNGVNESLRAVYSFNGFDLTSVSALSQADMEGEMELFQSGNYYSDWEMGSDRFAQELRLSSNESKSQFTWLVGGFFQNGEMTYDNVYYNSGMNSGGADAVVKQQTYSLFGQCGYTMFDSLTLTPGIRYDHDSKEIENKSSNMAYTDPNDPSTAYLATDKISDSESWNAISPRLAVDYRITKDAMVYTSVARAYKAGGFAMSAAFGNPDNIKFDPEDSRSIELGTKTSWLNNRLLVNLAGFYSMIDDMQVFYLDPATYAHIYTNVGKATMYGLEAEIAVRPLDEVEVGMPLGLINSEITEHKTSSYEGNKAPLVPEYTAGLFAQYTHNIGLFLRGEGTFLGKTYFDEANDKSQDAYVVLNARLGYKGELVSVSAYVNNVLNEEYYNYRVAAGGGSTDFASVGAPRTMGVQVDAAF